MAEVKPPRPRNLLVAEFPGLSKDDASQALRDAGGDLGKARELIKQRRDCDMRDSDEDDDVLDLTASADEPATKKAKVAEEKKFTGVQKRPHSQTWYARALTHYLGTYPTSEAAARAVDKHYVSKGRRAVNFPDDEPGPATLQSSSDVVAPLAQLGASAAVVVAALRAWAPSGRSPSISDVVPCSVNGQHAARFRVARFDDGSEAGRNLDNDLSKLPHSCISMEITFPSNYPARPFFLRCVSPRFCWYTGHITSGGAICIESLTEGGWRPDISVETVLATVFENMLDVKVRSILTTDTEPPKGPLARSGPLRVDLKAKFHACGALVEYGVAEAHEAFARCKAHHDHYGW